MQALCLNQELTDDARRAALFAGDILLYSRSPSTASLCDHALEMIAEALSPHDPERAQFSLSVEEFVARVGPLKTRFTNDARTKELIRAILALRLRPAAYLLRCSASSRRPLGRLPLVRRELRI